MKTIFQCSQCDFHQEIENVKGLNAQYTSLYLLHVFGDHQKETKHNSIIVMSPKLISCPKDAIGFLTYLLTF
jgi:hypothetical protein